MATLAHNTRRQRTLFQQHGRHEAAGMHSPDDDHMNEGVYARIKNHLLMQPPVPGQLLQIGALAAELGVSTTPVREALTRLAAERLIVCAPRKGFFAKIPSEEEIRGLHRVNQTLLDAALDAWSCTDESMPDRPELPVNWRTPPGQDAQHLVRRTVELFSCIAMRSGIAELTQVVHNISDRLHHPRLVECEIIDDTREILLKMCSLYAAVNRGGLRVALRAYHEKRLLLITPVCKELLFRSFLSEERGESRASRNQR
jgi:hypothetical protein